jgi:hypothetical protein
VLRGEGVAMSLRQIIEGQKKGCWLRDIRGLLNAVPGYVLTENEAKEAVTQLKVAIVGGWEGPILGWIALGLTRSTGRFLAEARSQGVFRLSGHDYRSKTLTNAVQEILRAIEQGELKVAPDVTFYFQNVLRLHTISEAVHDLTETIKNTIRARGPGGLKAALIMTDFVFLLASTRGHPTDKTKHLSHPYFFSPEELAEGFSLVFSLATEQPGEWPIKNTAVDTRTLIKTDEPMNLLRAGAVVRFFREAEVMVDVYGFTLEPTGTNRFEFRPPNPDFLKAMRYGYMRYQLRQLAHVAGGYDTGRPMLREVAEKLADTSGEKFVVRKNNPERFTFYVPGFPKLKEILNAQWLYQEEYLMWSHAARELLTTVDNILDFEVADGVTIHDVLKLQRCVNFFRWYAVRYLLKELPKKPGVVLQSLLSALSTEQTVEYFGQIVEKEKVEKLVDLLAFRPDRDKFFDVLYQPLLRTTHGVIFGTNLFGSSNLVRNLLQLTRRRLFHDGKIDPLKRMAREALAKRADYVHSKDLNYRVGARSSDVDVLVLWGGVLFVLECKNALHAAGPFELRNSNEHILKANEQLNLFRLGFADPEFRKDLAKKIGKPIPDGTRLITSILISNRMFLGLKMGENTVRSVFEMKQFLEEGTITVADEVKQFWKDKPTSVDLCQFFDGELTVKPYWDAMKDYREKYTIGRFEVSVHSFKLDMEKLAENFGLDKARQRIGELKAEHRAALEEHDAKVESCERLAEWSRRREL